MVDEIITELEPEELGTDRPARILIVDDDEEQVFALQFRLKKLGYQTTVAHSGRAALEIASTERLDLVLLDLRLPDTTGFKICEQFADSPATCGIPVIIVSGMEEPEIVRKARSAGCEFYVRKPYDPNVLLALIENALRNADEDCW